MSEQTLQIGNLTIPVKIIKGAPRRVRLRFEDAYLVVETGAGKIESGDLSFIQSKARWIARHYPSIAAHNERRTAFAARADRETLIFGQITPVSFQTAAQPRYDLKDDVGLIITYPPRWEKYKRKSLVVSALRTLANQYLQVRLDEWAKTCGLTYNRLVVKDHRSKWGSCSSNRNINLNWTLVMMNKAAIDYVIVHELMHLLEMNHSDRFWNHVAKFVPDYEKHIKHLKENQWLIGIYD